MNRASKTNLKDKVYDLVKQKIVLCELMPGTVINLADLVEELGVSKTPVRDAINALETEGLLVVLPRRAVIVSQISLRDIEHIYMIRETLEPMITRIATPLFAEDRLSEFRDVFQDEDADYTRICLADRRLHLYLAESTGNPYLVRLMDQVLSHNMRIVVMGARIPDRIRKSNDEHLEIIDLLLKRDAHGAEEAMRQHIASARGVAYAVSRGN
jgi:DNA-binding GntR family transcriptional regulator